MSEREITALVHRAITHAASEQLAVAIRSIHVTRGWGEILFVKVQARLADRSAREQMEQRFAAAVREALNGQRTSVSVSWIG